MEKLNGFNNGRDTTDGVGGKPGPFDEAKYIKTGESGDKIKFIKSGKREPIKNIGVLFKESKEKQMEKHIKEIKEKGYTILPQRFNQEGVKSMLEEIKDIYEKTKDKISKDTPYLNLNSPNIYNIQNKGLHWIYTLLEIEGLEEILKTFLNDKWYKQIPQDQPNYILRSFGARSSNTALPLHIDSFIPYTGDEVIAMQVAIMLEDSTIENGCTLVVPGSHNWGIYANNSISKDQIIPLEAKAGDVLIWDSRIHHATTENKTEGTRWAIIATFCRYWMKAQFDIPGSLPKHIKDELTPKEKSILGFCSIPPKDEYEGIEMKKGYENV